MADPVRASEHETTADIPESTVEGVGKLTGGVRHLYEARMKERRRTHGHTDHAADPEG